MTYCTISYCVTPSCTCEHRRGVILYNGPNKVEAEKAVSESPYREPDYKTVIEKHPDV